MSGVNWTGDKAMSQNMAAYGRAMVAEAEKFALLWAPRLEAHAKRHGPWTDRTANARQSLHGYLGDRPPEQHTPKGAGAGESLPYPTPQQVAADVVMIFLSHGMEYGAALETKYSGYFAIIWPTIEYHLPQMRREWESIFQ